MGNTVNIITEAIDAGEDINTFLARTVLNGTWADILNFQKSNRGDPSISDVQAGAFTADVVNLFEDMLRDYMERVGNTAEGITATLGIGETITEGLSMQWQDDQGTPKTRAQEDFLGDTWRKRFFDAGGVLKSTLSVATLTGVMIFSGTTFQGVDAVDGTVSGMTVRGGNVAVGDSAVVAGAAALIGGDNTFVDSAADGGPASMRPGNATTGEAGLLTIGGNIGGLGTTVSSSIVAPGVNSNNPVKSFILAGGPNTGGGFNGLLILHGGEPAVSDSNNRACGGILGHGGDGGGGGLTSAHAGGPATWRGGDGIAAAAGGNNTVRAGDSGPDANADAGIQAILGGRSTGNRVGGFINNVGGPAEGSGAGGSWTYVPGTSGSGIQGTMVVGSATVDFTGNALNVTGTNGRVLVYDNATNVTNKAANLGLAHYTNAEEPFFVLLPRVTTSTNVLNVGGGDSIGNAATLIDFYTAANNTTPTGTSRMTINSAGLVTVTGNFTMSGTSPTFKTGDGVTAGSPTFNLLKGPTGSTIINFFDTDLAAGDGDYRIRHSSAEQLLVEEHDGTTFRVQLQFISPASILVMAGAQANALLTIGNSSFTTAQSAALLLLSGATGLPTIQFDTSNARIRYDVGAVRMALIVNNIVGLQVGNGTLGFYTTAPIAKPTVSGARDDPEAALANLLTAAANIGWLTDSTTAS